MSPARAGAAWVADRINGSALAVATPICWRNSRREVMANVHTSTAGAPEPLLRQRASRRPTQHEELSVAECTPVLRKGAHAPDGRIRLENERWPSPPVERHRRQLVNEPEDVVDDDLARRALRVAQDQEGQL